MEKINIPTGNVIAFIRSVYPTLTKAEKKVADVVLSEVKNIIFDSLTDLAEKAGVGDTSVLRFCRHIGYKGFQEFKLALAQELDSGQEQLGDSIGDGITEQVRQKNLHIINETTALLKEEQIREAVNMLLRARQIVFFGVGSSGFTAEIAKYRFIRTGLPVEAVTDGHLGPVKATLMTESDVAVLLSVSGSTVDMVDIARIAKEEGKAGVVCITSHIKSPVTKYADVVLLSSSREKPTEGSAFTSTIPQLYILDIIFAHVMQELGETAEGTIRKTARATSKNLY
ncbi:MurR/RpiR family transcriptional regulator [Paenibacillus sp. 7124]|uniref:MurR/RpiR family transcriptional regulator n=1 Tax=Paenibacillus apii TaxID=1850370 RepID=A0A6M1PIT4_9BACL|nr:MurR/RpiR family transcriptional regulator [Paenibacillus apii]NGM82464.1 MurR/RpiR family transcriptional regulator [Paenibacillus apii]NJJ39604.1 MurR/RpiR family transcriptional regulator [Paenibacillus apii]